MPIDPYTALNAMLRAEAARFTPPVRQSDPAAPLKSCGRRRVREHERAAAHDRAGLGRVGARRRHGRTARPKGRPGGTGRSWG